MVRGVKRSGQPRREISEEFLKVLEIETIGYSGMHFPESVSES